MKNIQFQVTHATIQRRVVYFPISQNQKQNITKIILQFFLLIYASVTLCHNLPI
jgi:hypothetical protein